MSDLGDSGRRSCVTHPVPETRLPSVSVPSNVPRLLLRPLFLPRLTTVVSPVSTTQ